MHAQGIEKMLIRQHTNQARQVRTNGTHGLNTNRERQISDVGTGEKQVEEEANVHSCRLLQIQPQNHRHP